MGHIHAANPAKSKRLKDVLDLLRKRGDVGATTREIIRICEVCAVNAIIPELRQVGYDISCTTKVDAETGARIATYRLVGAGRIILAEPTQESPPIEPQAAPSENVNQEELWKPGNKKPDEVCKHGPLGVCPKCDLI